MNGVGFCDDHIRLGIAQADLNRHWIIIQWNMKEMNNKRLLFTNGSV